MKVLICRTYSRVFQQVLIQMIRHSVKYIYSICIANFTYLRAGLILSSPVLPRRPCNVRRVCRFGRKAALMLAVLILNLSGYLIVLLRSNFVAVCALRVLLGLASCGLFQTPFVMGEGGVTAGSCRGMVVGTTRLILEVTGTGLYRKEDRHPRFSTFFFKTYMLWWRIQSNPCCQLCHPDEASIEQG